jgi:hypothetical protein
MVLLSGIRCVLLLKGTNSDMDWIMMRFLVMWLSQLPFGSYLLWLSLANGTYDTLIFRMLFFMVFLMRRYIWSWIYWSWQAQSLLQTCQVTILTETGSSCMACPSQLCSWLFGILTISGWYVIVHSSVPGCNHLLIGVHWWYIVISSLALVIHRFISQLRSGFSVKYLGALHYFLGIEVSSPSSGTLLLLRQHK